MTPSEWKKPSQTRLPPATASGCSASEAEPVRAAAVRGVRGAGKPTRPQPVKYPYPDWHINEHYLTDITSAPAEHRAVLPNVRR